MTRKFLSRWNDDFHQGKYLNNYDLNVNVTNTMP